MVLTPLDLQNNKEFRKSTRGYNQSEVDSFLARVFKDYEELYSQNLDLQEELAEVKEKLNQYQLIEDTLQNTLVLAQQTAEEIKKNAEEEASLIIDRATHHGEKLLLSAEARINQLRAEYERLKQLEVNYRIKLKTFFQTQLTFLDGELISLEKTSEEAAAAFEHD